MAVPAGIEPAPPPSQGGMISISPRNQLRAHTDAGVSVYQESPAMASKESNLSCSFNI